MHIRAFLGAALLGLVMVAASPLVAMTVDEPPEICVLDFAQPALDLVEPIAPTCAAVDIADVSFAFDSAGGDEGDAAWSSCAPIPAPLALSLYRQHVDPGRCSA